MTDQTEREVNPSPDQATLDPHSEGEAAAAAAGHDSPEETNDVETLRQALEASREEATANQDRYLRTRAEMENYKKRVERTYADLAKSSKKNLLSKLLGVKDNLERALQYGESTAGNGEGIIEGVRLTQYQLDQLLESEGVKPIDVDGKPFDPRLEEAIQTVDDLSVPDHSVVQVVRNGYTYDDEVLRPAQVIVSVHGDGK
jgi:molecular chaperone GrpE